jgi:hypothetical protein
MIIPQREALIVAEAKAHMPTREPVSRDRKNSERHLASYSGLMRGTVRVQGLHEAGASWVSIVETASRMHDASSGSARLN